MPSRKNFRPASMRAKGGDSMPENNISLEQVGSFISNMNQLLKKLKSATEELPKVDSQGHSECDFAEQLYYQKDEAAQKVEAESKKLQPYLEFVEQEVARCSRNLEEIRKDARSLNRHETKEKYDIARRAQENQYNEVIKKRNALVELLSRTATILGLARSKEFPGGRKPQQRYRLPGILGGPGTTGSETGVFKPLPGSPSFNNGINGLISLGPGPLGGTGR